VFGFFSGVLVVVEFALKILVMVGIRDFVDVLRGADSDGFCGSIVELESIPEGLVGICYVE
jgi:hypothetical protein